MADNTELNTGSGGDTIATDDIGGIKHQRVKIQYGADGSATDVSDANPLPIDDAGGSLTVDNADLTTLAGAVSGSEMQVDIVSSALPSGAATAANQSTANTALSGIQTAVELIDNAISGSEMQVDIVSGNVGVTGTVTVDLGANNDVTIDNSSIVHAEDTAHNTGDAGFMALGVRQDTQVDFGADGDYVPLSIDSAGAVRVTGGGGGTQYSIDDAAPTVVTLAGTIRDDSLTTLTEADGDASTLRVNSQGALHVTGGGGGTEYTVDVAAPTAPTGTATLFERDDALSTLTEIEGDWIQARCSAEGALWTQDFNSDAVLSTLGDIDTSLNNIEANVGGTHTDNAAFTGGTDDGVPIFGLYDTTPPTTTDGSAAAIRMNSTRAMHVSIQEDSVGIGGGTQYTEGDTDATITGNAMMMEVAADTLEPVQGTVADGLLVNLGTNNDVSLAAQLTDDAAFVPGTSSVVGAGFIYNETSPNVSTEDDIGAARMSQNRNLYTQIRDAAGNERGVNVNASNQMEVSVENTVTVDLGVNNDVTVTSGTITANLGATDNAVLDNIDTNTTRGSSHYRNVDANAEAAIKGSAGTLHWIHAVNLTAAIAYLHLYDATTASVTPGTTPPDFTFPIPTQGDTNGAGFNLKLDQEFANAITLVCTTTIDGSAGDPGTNGVMVNAGYS